MTKPDIVLLGAFPPPLGGASKNNQILYEELTLSGQDVKKINNSGPTLAHSRGVSYHLSRLITNIRASFKLLGGGRALYVVPDGGLGVWYTFLQLSIATRVFEKIIIHHRTFQYIDKRNAAMRMIVSMTAHKSLHVFLSGRMLEKFEAQYGSIASLISTNARYVKNQAHQPIVEKAVGPLKLGHLSNLCREKGFFDVADTFEAAVSRGLNCELHIAGPEIEPEVSQRMGALRDSYPGQVFSHGSLGGQAKDDFYSSLDVFLFPTRFPQEAAPNVVYEALAAGNYVIVNDRGCVQDMISAAQGTVVQEAEFVKTAVEQLLAFGQAGLDVATASAIQAELRNAVITSEDQYSELLSRLLPKSVGNG